MKFESSDIENIEKDELVPSESEWVIMEVLWESDVPLTSIKIINRLQGKTHMTSRMVRVLINRLCQKSLIGFNVDGSHARIYHYFALRTREECLKEKNQRFLNSYFAGNRINAVASILQDVILTEEQISELEEIISICASSCSHKQS